MAFTESDVYNNEAFFEQYMKRRYRENSPNESLEKPAFFQLIGDVKGKKILDLGCGDAKFGEELLENGCHSYTGIEGSELMYEKAKKQLENKNGTVHCLNLKDYTYPPSTFDLVTSRLALHYIEHLPIIFQNVYEALKTNGTFTFSVQHPVITSSFESLQTSGKERAGSSMIILKLANGLSHGLTKKLLNTIVQQKSILHCYNKPGLRLQT
ncbi:class I SAM-dependent methyltransferase [Bacillus wiedmannii]|uniref:class I SAM-dependent methyltransferase n=1 Tax=Bacillus wiedmannii TaxID=1890302 RepID=UPI0021D15968|nr:class I SAM-dependent methyltransferase [Bacillus wiedmannii]MCU5598396.1 class I SAM-dependent methyltransferase [Bacillus wiedmannii]